MLTQFKLSGTYPLIYGIRLSGSFQSSPGTERSITYQVTRTQLPTLVQTSVNVRLNEPGTDLQRSRQPARLRDLEVVQGRPRGVPAGDRPVQHAQRQPGDRRRPTPMVRR